MHRNSECFVYDAYAISRHEVGFVAFDFSSRPMELSAMARICAETINNRAWDSFDLLLLSENGEPVITEQLLQEIKSLVTDQRKRINKLQVFGPEDAELFLDASIQIKRVLEEAHCEDFSAGRCKMVRDRVLKQNTGKQHQRRR